MTVMNTTNTTILDNDFITVVVNHYNDSAWAWMVTIPSIKGRFYSKEEFSNLESALTDCADKLMVLAHSLIREKSTNAVLPLRISVASAKIRRALKAE